MNLERWVVLLCLTLFSANCATMAHGSRQRIAAASNPTGADVAVMCGKPAGPRISEHAPASHPKTPTEINVSRRAQPCSVTLTKEGYEPASVAFSRKLSGWFWGNIFFGGVVGMIIDASSGGIYVKESESVNVTLQRSAGAAAPEPTPAQPQ